MIDRFAQFAGEAFGVYALARVLRRRPLRPSRFRGTFTLTLRGRTTAPIPYAAGLATVQTAVDAIQVRV